MAIRSTTLLATLKKTEQSNTEVLCDFLHERMRKKGIVCETLKLVQHRILPGTYSDMGDGDDWPSVLVNLLVSDVIIFATPVWWGGHSSEMQRVIERLDEIHDEILEGKRSRMDGKVGGIVITGDSDGAQHIIANIANFINAIGIILPPYATLSVLSEKQRKGATTSRDELMELYEKDYAKTTDKMIDQILRYAASTTISSSNASRRL